MTTKSKNEIAINMAEDRDLFDQAMKRIGLECPKAKVAHTMDEAWEIQAELGFPTIIRPSYTMGGSGGGVAYNKEEFEEIMQTPVKSFHDHPTYYPLIKAFRTPLHIGFKLGLVPKILYYKYVA